MKRTKEMYGCHPSEYAEKNAEINLSVVPFQQDCCRLKRIQGYFCSIIFKRTMKMNFMKRAGFVLTCATMLANLCAAQNTERTPQGMKCTT